MTPNPNPTSRRAFLKGSFVAALLATSPSAALAAAKATAKKKATKSAVPTTTPTTKPTAKPTTRPTAAAGSATELAVSFAYVADGGFRVRNPYVAVYIEDANGELVRTVSLSIQSGKGSRWWPELRSWWRMDQARITGGGADDIDTISSPTRVPGTYKVLWNGLSESKKPVPNGEYFLNIEAAMEHGPYDLLREPITVGSAFSKQLADSGSIQGVTIEMRRV